MKNKLTKEMAAERDQFRMHIKIIERAEKEIIGWKGYVSRLSANMDLESVPELDLEKLLNAPLKDFAHDMCGIRRHMDRSTYPGKLTDCFWPRCCRNEPVAV